MDSVQLLYIHRLYVLLILYRVSWIQSSQSLDPMVDPMTPCQATRGLNLSEDIFAGLDLSLRGGWTVYREYFHVGKAQGIGEIVAWHPNSLRDFRFQISDMDFIGDSLSLTCRLVWSSDPVIPTISTVGSNKSESSGPRHGIYECAVLLRQSLHGKCRTGWVFHWLGGVKL